MTATLDVPDQNPDLVLEQSADDYWNHYQLTFALYSVSDRAIPSAFDGLKPGQRRLLYQMHDSKLLPGNKPQKSSKICSTAPALTRGESISSIRKMMRPPRERIDSHASRYVRAFPTC